MNIHTQSELLLKSRVFDLFEYVVGTRFSIEQQLATHEDLYGKVTRLKVWVALPASQVELLWLHVSVFSSGRIVFSDNTSPKPEMLSVSPDSEEELAEAIADVFNDFIDTMRAQISALD